MTPLMPHQFCNANILQPRSLNTLLPYCSLVAGTEGPCRALFADFMKLDYLPFDLNSELTFMSGCPEIDMLGKFLQLS